MLETGTRVETNRNHEGPTSNSAALQTRLHRSGSGPHIDLLLKCPDSPPWRNATASSRPVGNSALQFKGHHSLRSQLYYLAFSRTHQGRKIHRILQHKLYANQLRQRSALQQLEARALAQHRGIAGSHLLILRPKFRHPIAIANDPKHNGSHPVDRSAQPLFHPLLLRAQRHPRQVLPKRRGMGTWEIHLHSLSAVLLPTRIEAATFGHE